LLQEFLAEVRSGVALEDDQVIFELDSTQYSISSERGRCLLHLWSEERNLVREVVDAIAKAGVLELTVRSFAKARPHKLQLCRDRDRRTASAKKLARTRYARLLERVLRRQAPEWMLDKNQLSTPPDLQRSFSPVYARGLLRKGRSAFAVLGVNRHETQASVDAALTFGLLWLEASREREAGRAVVEGLRLFVPRGRASTLQIRLAHLNHEAAKFQIVELEERDESFDEIDAADLGNINTRLVRLADQAQARERFASAIEKVLTLAPPAEVAVLSPKPCSPPFKNSQEPWSRSATWGPIVTIRCGACIPSAGWSRWWSRMSRPLIRGSDSIHRTCTRRFRPSQLPTVP